MDEIEKVLDSENIEAEDSGTEIKVPENSVTEKKETRSKKIKKTETVDVDKDDKKSVSDNIETENTEPVNMEDENSVTEKKEIKNKKIKKTETVDVDREVENSISENKETETVDKEDENSTTKNEIEKTEIINEVEEESESETTPDIPEILTDDSKSEKRDESDLNAIQIDETGELKWYAVRIISGHENKVKLYLDNQIKSESYEDKIRNVLIPLEKVFEVKNGKKKIKYKNFLPGYILVEAKLDDKVRSFISQSPSILNMVGSKSIKGKRLDPIPLRESELKRLKALLDEDAEGEKIDFQLSAGDPVKVISGPFNNFSGNVFEINTEKMKVKVMVSIFGRKTPIELEFTQVEKEK
jgi:transcriptional antiterminator NusG